MADGVVVALLDVGQGEAGVDLQGLAGGVAAVGLDEGVVDALGFEPGEQEVAELVGADRGGGVCGLTAQGASLLLTTQYIEEAERLAGTVVIIDHGKVIASGTPAQLRDRAGGDRLDLQSPPGQDARQLAAALAPLGRGGPAIDEEAGARGERVAVVKPAQTGVGPDEPGDLAEVTRLAGISGRRLPGRGAARWRGQAGPGHPPPGRRTRAGPAFGGDFDQAVFAETGIGGRPASPVMPGLVKEHR